MSYKEKIRDGLRSADQSGRYKQAAIAEAIGVSPSTLNNVLNGRNMLGADNTPAAEAWLRREGFWRNSGDEQERPEGPGELLARHLRSLADDMVSPYLPPEVKAKRFTEWIDVAHSDLKHILENLRNSQ